MSNRQPKLSNPNQSRLHRLLVKHFNREELRTLCFDLGVGFEDLGGEGISARARELLLYLERVKRIEALVTLAEEKRPNVNWRTGPPADVKCPYKGLHAFREDDEPYFFGREAFTQKLVDAVNTQSLAAVIGPSGSGKSSVIFAGLVPALRQQGNWVIVDFHPGRNPFMALAQKLVPFLDPDKIDRPAKVRKLATNLENGDAALDDYLQMIRQERPDSRILLICDQFEELYTQMDEVNARHRFLDMLQTALPDGASEHSTFKPHPSFFSLILTLRADFMGQVLAYPPMVNALQNSDVKIGLMNRDELERAIVQPAANVGVSFEPGLVDRMLEEVGDQAGNLPLLEFALTLLWERQNGGKITHVAYDAIGGVSGALVQHAGETIDRLTEDNPTFEREVQQVMVQLVHPGVGVEDTKRVARRIELGEAGWEVVSRLANTRLLVTGRERTEQNTLENAEEAVTETVEIVHEALIKNWGRLQRWLEQDREFRVWQERLRIDRQQWLSNDEANGYLLQGAPLTVAAVWLDKRYSDLSEPEIAYIETSLRQKQEQDAAEEDRRQRELRQAQALAAEQQQRAEVERKRTEDQRKANKQLRRFTMAAAVLALMALVAAGISIYLGQKANRDSRIAQARALTVEANRWLDHNRIDQALIRAYQAVNITYQADGNVTDEASVALFDVWNQQTRLPISQFSHDDIIRTAIFHPEQELILTASDDKSARLWDFDGNQLTLLQHDAPIRSAIFHPEKELILTTSDDKSARLWDFDGNQLAQFPHDAFVNSTEFHPEQDIILTVSGLKSVSLWDFTGNEMIRISFDDALIWAAHFRPEQDIILALINSDVRLWDFDGNELARLTHNQRVWSAIFHPEENFILTLAEESNARLWNLDSNQLTMLPHDAPVRSAVFHPEQELILTASDGNSARLWNFDGSQLTVFPHDTPVRTAIFHPEKDRILTISGLNSVRLWDFDGNQLTLIQYDALINFAAFHPKQDLLLTRDDGSARLWDFDGNQLAVFPHDGPGISAIFHPEKDLVLTYSPGNDDKARLWGFRGNQLAVYPRAVPDTPTLHPEQDLILTIGDDNSASLWDFEGNQLVKLSHDASVWLADFHPKQNLILTRSDDNSAYLWDFDGDKLTRLQHDDSVNTAIFHPEKELILTASSDNSVRLWDFEGNQLTLFQHDDSVNTAIFHPEKELILTASSDGAAHLWDFNGNQRATFPHSDWVWSAIFHSEKDLVLTVSQDGTGRLWRFFPTYEAMMAEAKRNLHVILTRKECEQQFADFDLTFCEGWDE